LRGDDKSTLGSSAGRTVVLSSGSELAAQAGMPVAVGVGVGVGVIGWKVLEAVLPEHMEAAEIQVSH
jgi:hypothetical protein